MAAEYLMLDDYMIPGYGLTVALSIALKDADASGDSSSTARAAKGKKAKKLEVTTRIRFRDEADLGALFARAEAVKKGDGVVYTVTNRTANAAGMRQGRFSGDVKADPQEGLAVWLVTFTLAEHKSVPERAEEREPDPAVQTPQNEGAAVASPPAEAPQEEQMDRFQQFLKSMDETLTG